MHAVGERLRRACEDDKWVARYAGDEFVLIDAAPQTAEHAARFAKELVELIELPFELGEDSISISASVGIAFGDVSSDPDEVIRDADVAMYEAKNGDDRAAVYTDAMRARLTPATAERRLEAALADGEFTLLFQPIVALRTRSLVGVEALLRWEDPSRGVIAPRDFLTALEDTGLIVSVGRWVIDEACRQAAHWSTMAQPGHPPLRVTANVSPRQLAQADFADDVHRAIDAAGVDPSLMFLEVTEAALISDPRTAWSSLTRVRQLGVGLALDDFGSGYSSLTHLRSFDLELLKLHGAFVDSLAREPKSDAIIRHVISLARSLGIATLAEGLSEPKHIDLLVELGCELGQGFHFAEPQPASVIDDFLARRGASVEAVAAATPVGGVEPEPAVVLPRLRRTGD